MWMSYAITCKESNCASAKALANRWRVLKGCSGNRLSREQTSDHLLCMKVPDNINTL